MNLTPANALLLPASHDINKIIVTSWTMGFEEIVNNVYNNAVAKNITNGSVTLHDLSPDSFTVQTLVLFDSLETLGWTITYVE